MSLPAISTAAPAESVFELVARLHREHQLTSLIATHNLAFARRCHRVLRLDQGKNGRSGAGVASGCDVNWQTSRERADMEMHKKLQELQARESAAEVPLVTVRRPISLGMIWRYECIMMSGMVQGFGGEQERSSAENSGG